MVKVAAGPAVRFAEVAVPVPLRRTFTYRVPADLADRVGPGAVVTVPFGRRTLSGFVIALHPTAEVKGIKDIQKVEDDDLSLSPALLELGAWVSEYYLAPLGEVLRAALPAGLGKKTPDPVEAMPGDGVPPVLSDAQTAALEPIREAVRKKTAASFLLHGVTGSGKTEVYLRAAEEAVRAGGRVLVLVPEIALSPQMVERVRERFGNRTALWHSSLTPARRREVWTRTRRGEIDVLVGARSAVFAPLPDLRLVVVDEEHESTYKQTESPRYHARDVALVRARLEGATVVLGSATPSLETYANTERGKYRLLELPARVGEAVPPEVSLVPPPRAEAGERAPISVIFGNELRRALAERLGKGEQSIVFLNRRGHSTVVQCSSCHEAVSCSACDVVLTYHAAGDRLECHYCGARRPRPRACGACGEETVIYKGVGTQKVEGEIARLFPAARVRRLDTDSARRRGVLEESLDSFRTGEVDILLGTQMVAKGLDFPRVTLVGVVNADTQLLLPDFRSAERTFQLLTQVAGRAGRGSAPGQVILQTAHPDHPALVAAARQDYGLFYREEMRARAETGWPPHKRLVNLMLDGSDEATVIAEAEKLAAHLLREVRGGDGLEVLGPAPQPVSRLKGKHRWHVTLRGGDHRRLHRLAARALALAEERTGRVRLAVDVDPASLL